MIRYALAAVFAAMPPCRQMPCLFDATATPAAFHYLLALPYVYTFFSAMLFHAFAIRQVYAPRCRALDAFIFLCRYYFMRRLHMLPRADSRRLYADAAFAAP